MSFLTSLRPPSPAITPAKQPGTAAPAAPHAHEPESRSFPSGKLGTHQRGLAASPFGPLAPSSLFGHYADGLAATPGQQRNDHTRDVLSNSAGFLLNKVDATASQIAKADPASSLGQKAGKVAKIANGAGLALNIGSGVYDGIRDPKHADEIAAKTAGSIGGGIAGAELGALAGPLAPVASPLLATGGSLAGGYAAGKAYPLIKNNPIGAALGLPMGPAGVLAGSLGQKGIEASAPYVHQAFDTAEHYTTSALHGAGDLAGSAGDLAGDAGHAVSSGLHSIVG